MKRIGIHHPRHMNNAGRYFSSKIEQKLQELKNERVTTSAPLWILDIGCGKHSSITQELKEKYNCILYALDISGKEMEENKVVDERIVFDACNSAYGAELKDLQSKFDLIISSYFLEHIKAPEIFNAMVAYLLKKHGKAVHLYSTLFDPFVFLGHIVPQGLSRKVLFALEPYRQESGKFPSYYVQCRAFSRKLSQRYSPFGMRVSEYRNFYGTNYLLKIPPLQLCADIFSMLSITLDIRMFASSSCLVLTKRP